MSKLLIRGAGGLKIGNAGRSMAVLPAILVCSIVTAADVIVATALAH